MNKLLSAGFAAATLLTLAGSAMALDVRIADRQVFINGIEAGTISATPQGFAGNNKCAYRLAWRNEFNPNGVVTCKVLESATAVNPSCGANAFQDINAFVTNADLNCRGYDNTQTAREVATNGLNLGELATGLLAGSILFEEFPFEQDIAVVP
jgi:hypothetical protein